MQYILTEEEYKNLQTSYNWKKDYFKLVEDLKLEIDKVDKLFPDCKGTYCDDCPFNTTHQFNDDTHNLFVTKSFFGYNYSLSTSESKCLLGRNRQFSK